MEPISLIAGALAAGATAGLKDTSKVAIVDAYKGLKMLVQRYWSESDVGDKQTNQVEAKVLLDNLQQDPQTFQGIVEQKLTQVLPNPPQALINEAQQLQSIIEQYGSQNQVTVSHSQGVQIGDKNTQNNQF